VIRRLFVAIGSWFSLGFWFTQRALLSLPAWYTPDAYRGQLRVAARIPFMLWASIMLVRRRQTLLSRSTPKTSRDHHHFHLSSTRIPLPRPACWHAPRFNAYCNTSYRKPAATQNNWRRCSVHSNALIVRDATPRCSVAATMLTQRRLRRPRLHSDPSTCLRAGRPPRLARGCLHRCVRRHAPAYLRTFLLPTIPYALLFHPTVHAAHNACRRAATCLPAHSVTAGFFLSAVGTIHLRACLAVPPRFG